MKQIMPTRNRKNDLEEITCYGKTETMRRQEPVASLSQGGMDASGADRENIKDVINRMIDEAATMFYAGEDEDKVRLVLREAKKLHIEIGGTAKDWPGLTDDRGMWDFFPYWGII
jgi:hypothetical protein